jgi:hypothetical protein
MLKRVTSELPKTAGFVYPLKYETSLIFHKWQNSFVYKHSTVYSTDSPFETSQLPWPLYINRTPTPQCSWLAPVSFLDNGHSASRQCVIFAIGIFTTHTCLLIGSTVLKQPWPLYDKSPLFSCHCTLQLSPRSYLLATISTSWATSLWSFPIPC